MEASCRKDAATFHTYIVVYRCISSYIVCFVGGLLSACLLAFEMQACRIKWIQVFGISEVIEICKAAALTPWEATPRSGVHELAAGI